MNHIDEGTIHAWIDGAVSAEQGRAVEAHVAQCAQCSAAVAEARGLVAASSRILNALDDVPANVTPKRKAPTAPQRQWRAASWVTGIAALLLAAVVLRTSREVPGPRSDASPPIAKPAVPAAPMVDTQRPPARAAANDARVAANDRPTLQKRPTVLAEQPATSNASGAGVASVVSAPPPRAATAATDVTMERRRDQAEAAAPLAPQPSPLMQPPAAIVDTAITDRDFAGCYSLTVRREQSALAGEPIAKAASQGMRARAAAPVAAEARVREGAALLPSTLLLDTVSERPGYVVRDASSHAAIGSWRALGRDSASVDLLQRGIVVVKRAAKRACPER